ncbi:MAG: S46 family peptidase [Acidobacteriota bacterium]|nr:S46 family peptidase [Acidobacteriota bacterium]
MSRILKGLRFAAGAGLGLSFGWAFTRRSPRQLPPVELLSVEPLLDRMERMEAEMDRQTRRFSERTSVLERTILEQSISIRSLRQTAEEADAAMRRVIEVVERLSERTPAATSPASFEALLGKALENPRPPNAAKVKLPLAGILIGLLAVGLSQARLSADEGLWPYNQFPAEALKQKYAFDAAPGFLDELRLSSVRIGSAGAGSFVSAKALLLTTRQMVNAVPAKIAGGLFGRAAWRSATPLSRSLKRTARPARATYAPWWRSSPAAAMISIGTNVIAICA